MGAQFTKQLHGTAPRRQRGLTLIELMTTVSVIVVVLSIGVPSFQNMIAANRVTTTTNTFISILSLARSEALKRSATMHIYPEDTSTGVVVAIAVDSTDEVINRIPLDTSTDLHPSFNELRFLRTGFIDAAAEQTVTVCDNVRTGETGRKITIGISGKTSLTEYACDAG